MRMKFTFATAISAVACVAAAGTNDVPVIDEPVDSALTASVGADLRIREEIMHNVPGLPGAPGAVMPRAYKKNINHMRIRPRVWGSLEYEEFTLYTRLTDEFREHFIENGVKRKRRAYNFPDEVVLDNLWFGGKGLFDGFLDFRIGRQDLFDGLHSLLGLDRIIIDGSPYVGSRCCYAGMICFTLHTTETSKLDTFALYDNGRKTRVAWPADERHPPRRFARNGRMGWRSRLERRALRKAPPIPALRRPQARGGLPQGVRRTCAG